MEDFDITQSRSSFFASLSKRKKLGLDSDSDSDDDGNKRTKSNGTSKNVNNAQTGSTSATTTSTTATAQPATAVGSTTTTTTTTIANGIEPAQGTSITIQPNTQAQQPQPQPQPQQKDKGKQTAITLDDDWLKEVESNSKPPPPRDDLINLSSDDEEIEPLDASMMEELDPELKAMVYQENNTTDHVKPNKIDIKLQYVNNNVVDERYRTLLEKLLKPIKIRVMDDEQLDRVFTVFCTHKKLKKDDVILVYNDNRVFLRTTPQGLGMKPDTVYILYVYPKHAYESKIQKEKDEREQKFLKRRELESKMDRLLTDDIDDSSSPGGGEASQSEGQDQRMVVILREKEGEEIHLRVKPSTSLKALVENYAKIRKLGDSSKIRLLFEGETLSQNDTVEDVGLEDEDLIDVLLS